MRKILLILVRLDGRTARSKCGLDLFCKLGFGASTVQHSICMDLHVICSRSPGRTGCKCGTPHLNQSTLPDRSVAVPHVGLWS
jgi:hypothetical protein